MPSEFAVKLLNWYDKNHRDLPWRNTKDPYLIWLSEIILQQTRVAQGLPYYQRFTDTFPSVGAFASAEEDEILKLWQGLGYYSRARNMHKAAQKIVNQHNSMFPNTYKELLDLPGVGPYTAAAIASFAFDLAHPVIDGNVQRVIARYAGITDPINSKIGANKIEEFLSTVFAREHPAKFNQAIMEFGAIQCTPRSPECEICPFSSSCVAFKSQTQDEIPIKIRKTSKKNRYLNYLIPIDTHGYTFMHKRTGKGIWQNLYQFPLHETSDTGKFATDLEGWSAVFDNIPAPSKEANIDEWRTNHILSHQNLNIRFVVVQLDHEIREAAEGFQKTHISSILTNFAVPRIIEKFVIDVGWS